MCCWRWFLVSVIVTLTGCGAGRAHGEPAPRIEMCVRDCTSECRSRLDALHDRIAEMQAACYADERDELGLVVLMSPTDGTDAERLALERLQLNLATWLGQARWAVTTARSLDEACGLLTTNGPQRIARLAHAGEGDAVWVQVWDGREGCRSPIDTRKFPIRAVARLTGFVMTLKEGSDGEP